MAEQITKLIVHIFSSESKRMRCMFCCQFFPARFPDRDSSFGVELSWLGQLAATWARRRAAPIGKTHFGQGLKFSFQNGLLN